MAVAQYVAPTELAAFLRIEDDGEDAYLEGFIQAATSAIDAHCGRSFAGADTSETARTFAARWADLIDVDPMANTTGLAIAVDTSGDGIFNQAWASTDYQLEPLNQRRAGLTNHPYTRIRAIESKTFPVGRRATVEVTARWGWATVPDAVTQAAMMHAGRLHERRNMPAGIIAGDGFIGRTSLGLDPDVKALLEKRGLLERIQGSGTYVRRKAKTGSIYEFFHLELKKGVGLPTAKILSLDLCDRPDFLPAFGDGSSDKAWRIHRLRKLGGVPAALEEIWFDARHAPKLKAADIPESLHLFYRERLGFWIARVEDKVSVSPCPDFAPKDGPFTPGAPMGFVERVSWGNADTIEEYSRNWFDPQTVCYAARWV